jgi:hypothetical protein
LISLNLNQIQKYHFDDQIILSELDLFCLIVYQVQINLITNQHFLFRCLYQDSLIIIIRQRQKYYLRHLMFKFKLIDSYLV